MPGSVPGMVDEGNNIIHQDRGRPFLFVFLEDQQFMECMKIGLIKEGKIPADKRVAFSPGQLAGLLQEYGPALQFKVEPSDVRCFKDEEYEALGIEVEGDLSDCDLLFGIKEVPIERLLEQKTYFFFSHTIKKQPQNKDLLVHILGKQIRLIDYEVLKNPTGERVAAFGRWAGIIGAYNGLWAYGQKTGLYDIKRAKDCRDYEELKDELEKIQLPPIKMVVTGRGRAGSGVVEVLEALGIKKVSNKELLHGYFEEPVYCQLASEDYNRRKTDGGFDREEFYANPEKYESHFLKFAEVSDILFGAAFWDPRAPKLFLPGDIGQEDFAISVIADISCDINGSIPTTIRITDIAQPVYDIDRGSFEELPPFGSQHSITVMAVDNLPCELPRDASVDFGKQLIRYLIPELLKAESEMLENATIAIDGQLTLNFYYLKDFVGEIIE